VKNQSLLSHHLCGIILKLHYGDRRFSFTVTSIVGIFHAKAQRSKERKERKEMNY
ncbi:MAG: hypothetical protein JWM28_577, partial [Chitinophagaceae bacterium]|nr:hypothetical protein [Chitinophagaceae bacterium]